jgi:hypothetical protein
MTPSCICRHVHDLERCSDDVADVTIQFRWATKYISLLQRLPQLKRLSFFHGSEIERFDGLEHLERVTELYAIGQHRLTDMSALRAMRGLRQLAVSAVWQLDIAPLEDMPFLERLELRDARKGYRALAGLTALEELRVSGLRMSSLKHIGGLTNLYLLDAQAMPLRSLKGFPFESPVSSVDLRDTTLRSLEPLSGHPRIEHLCLFGCKKLESLSAISTLGSLRELYLNHVKCAIDFDKIQPCEHLEVLCFHHASVVEKTLQALKDMKSLRSCRFTRYSFQSREDIEDLVGQMPWCRFEVSDPDSGEWFTSCDAESGRGKWQREGMSVVRRSQI